MDFNGNTNQLNFLIGKLRNPQTAQAAQEQFDQQRLNRIYAALATRPIFIGLKFDLPAAGSITPIVIETMELQHDLIIAGAITDSSRRFTIERHNENNPFAYTGNDDSLLLRLDEYAGRNLDNDVQGVFYSPCPKLVKEGDTEFYKVYKEDETVNPETAWLVLTGWRVYPSIFAEAQLSKTALARVSEAIARRKQPELRYAKVRIKFDADGNADFETPKFEEPFLLKGIKTNLTNSMIRLNVQGEPSFNTIDSEYLPIWALAAQPDSAELFAWQQRALFLDPNRRLEGKLKNTINETVFDADNEITLILETM